LSTFVKRRNHAVRDLVPRLTDEHPALGLIDLDLIDERAQELKRIFQSSRRVLHTIAAKATPLRAVLAEYARLGFGCEVASPGELGLAVATGFPPENIVFDSPAKTSSSLKKAFELGVNINFDNFDEVARFDEILDHHGTNPATGIGLRINPQLDSGTIASTSTATKVSKFGVGLRDQNARDRIIETYLDRPWMNQIHIHSGSQGMSLYQAAEGIQAVVELTEDINRLSLEQHGKTRITTIDIGGGLPVSYDSDDLTPDYSDYHDVLVKTVPQLFEYELITEFGRSLTAKAGAIFARVEHAKTTGGRRIAITHAGVHIVTRTAYMPDDWQLRVFALNPDGREKQTPEIPHDIAGPACFSGDLVAQERMLPRLDSGDTILVPDTGAYCFTSHYSYNMLSRVPVVGYRETSEATLAYSLLRPAQSVNDLLAEVGPQTPIPLSEDGFDFADCSRDVSTR